MADSRLRPRAAALLGSTGATGQKLLPLLLADPSYAKVITLTRRPSGITHPKLENRVVDFEDLASGLEGTRVDDCYCTFGTTIRIAGSEAAMTRIDHDYVIAFAKACLAAGAHPHLIPVLGRIAGHPGGAEGLVMRLIDPAFRSLAGPPSLESCTRDVYAGDCAFALSVVLRIALGIASAARHLHERGIVHGDLYAHNILHDGAGGVLLGDFGAASLYAPGDAAEALQRIEVRAFACLLEELLERCAMPSPGLAALHAACGDADPQARPLFAEIERVLLAELEPGL